MTNLEPNLKGIIVSVRFTNSQNVVQIGCDLNMVLNYNGFVTFSPAFFSVFSASPQVGSKFVFQLTHVPFWRLVPSNSL